MSDPILRITARVYTSATLLEHDNAGWTLEPHLECLSLVTGCAPTVDSAILRWPLGFIQRESLDAADNVPDPVDLLSLRGKFVKVVINTSTPREWYGFVVKETQHRGPQGTIPDGIGGEIDVLTAGDQIFEAVGLEWFLQRQTVHHSKVATLTGGELTIERAIAFNAGMGDGRSITYEKRANKEIGAEKFAASKDTAEEWNGAEIVQYLLAEHSPKDDNGDPVPDFLLRLESIPVLEWMTPTVQTAGRSVWQILNELIAQNRGLTWKLAEPFLFFGAVLVPIDVYSMATAAIVMPGGGTLPAAATQYAEAALDDLVMEVHPVVDRDESRNFHRVIARGARRRAVFTVSMASGNLAPGWRPADETTYKAALGADPKANDRYRQAKRFEPVYQFFMIPPDWDGKSNDGSGPPVGNAFACPENPQGSTSIIGSEPIAMPGLRLLRTMPLRVGWDYSDATAPIPRDPDDTSPEFQRPFAVIDVSDSGGAKWRFTEELNTTEEGSGATTKKTSYHLRTLEAAPGVQVSPGGGMPHALALNHFDPAVDGATQTQPEVDYEKMRVTACGEWDAYAEGAWPAAVPAASPVQTLYLYCGERYRQDWLAEGTIYDVEGDTLKTVTDGGPLRDDRNTLVEIARIAYEWYGVERATLTLVVADPTLPADYALGTLITTIGSGDYLETINATISQITYDLQGGTIAIMAGFPELDFVGLV